MMTKDEQEESARDRLDCLLSGLSLLCSHKLYTSVNTLISFLSIFSSVLFSSFYPKFLKGTQVGTIYCLLCLEVVASPPSQPRIHYPHRTDHRRHLHEGRRFHLQS